MENSLVYMAGAIMLGLGAIGSGVVLDLWVANSWKAWPDSLNYCLC